MTLGLEDQIELSKQLQKQSKNTSNAETEGQPQISTTILADKKLILKGIYKLDGEKLTYSVSAVGAARPTTFAVVKGSGQTLVKLQRFTTGEASIESALVKLGASLIKDEVGYITTVNFRNAKIVDDDLTLLKQLTKLTQVSLGNTAITDAGLLHLRDIKNLHNLHLNGTRITDRGLLHLKDHELWTLYLSDTQITDAGLLHLKPFGKLYNLHLSHTHVSDYGMRTLQTLPALDSLFLNGTGITDAGVAHLVRVSRLTGVHLADTKITDAAVRQLASLPKLSSISLGGTQATDASLGYLQKSMHVSFLSLARPHVGRKSANATKSPQRQFSAEAIEKLQAALPKLRIQNDR